jgi:DNA uptake protein ComE-like DNA-binding protein
MAHLTRKEMEAAIAIGGSVLYKGQMLWQAGQLPTEADLAEGDAAQSAVVASSLDIQIAALQAQRDRMSIAMDAPKPIDNAPPLQPNTPVTSIDALDAPTLDKLAAAGYADAAALSTATDEQLLAIPGIGQATLTKIRAAYPQG